MSSINSLSPLLGGVAGEYFVAAELSARGYIASITMRNTKGVDILCSNSDASRTVGIQVKTNKSSRREWMLNQKAESYFADNLFYVFVNLNDNESHPSFFIVPSKQVATQTKEDHATWLAAPGLGGKAHIDTTLRKFRDISEKYLDNWDSLGLGS
jgi:hypothetical protein